METSPISTTVRQRRKALGLTQQDLADLAGIDASTIGALERGHVGVRLDKLQLILEQLGLRLNIEEADGS